MEPYINNNVNDITYQPERSPILTRKRGDNSPKQLTFISFRKLWAH
jgi:hypothetical protein